AKERAALKPARKLSRQLLHAINRRRLRHVFTQHVEILVQDRAFVSECRLEDRTAVHRVFNLPEDPRIRHSAAPDQNSIATSLTKLRKRSFDRRNVTAARYRHTHSFF